MTLRPAPSRPLLYRLSLALACISLALACLSPVLHAQTIEVNRGNRAISITATEQVSVLADIATVHVGYLLYGKDRDAAYSSATALSTAINKALTDSGIAPDSIESESQGLDPVQNFQDQNLSPAEAANRRFQVQQSWLVRVPANAASKALDVAVRAGANQSGQVDWSLSNENDAHATAAAHALARCREVAQQLASSSGGKAGALLFASNDSETAAPRPLPVAMQRVMGASQTLAINPRRIERSVTVHAVFAIEKPAPKGHIALTLNFQLSPCDGGARMAALPRFTGRLLPALALALLASSLPAEDATPNYAQERAESAQQLTGPFNWFSLVALQWLKPGTTTVGSAPGNALVLAGVPVHALTLEQHNGTVTVREAAPDLRLGGKPVTPGTVLTGEQDDAALSIGTVRLWAIDRSGSRYLRVKDSNAPARLHFHGLRWYPPEARYRVIGRWIPFDKPHTLTTHNQIGQAYDTPVPGYAEFTIDGKIERLLPLSASTEYGPWFVFRDETYRTDTYGGGRFLYGEKPSNGFSKPGTITIDFNEAYNPPCAYSPYATCPLAAPENRLPIAIPAGEKRYSDTP